MDNEIKELEKAIKRIKNAYFKKNGITEPDASDLKRFDRLAQVALNNVVFDDFE